jgi:hypothetical protein
MGLSMLALLLAIQHGVPRSRLGVATSLNQFARSVGAAIGVALMGAILSRTLQGVALPGGHGIPAGTLQLEGAARHEFARALSRVFASGAVTSALAFIGTLFLPAVSFAKGVPPSAGEQLLSAEMANLEPDDEPEGISRPA